ncbi:hypothetical protein HQN87_14820 [Paenibacillus tritici]|uniref:Uncharacterized protein n=1 Tax=Paenibacillus tritici TaxID=1873425 RepID=A0ABX2DQB8_9BACL|nr:hypothetical protein [Paenibacillus tritici]NQX46610.1 hypothetical protein [Paenibacillus tritici]
MFKKIGSILISGVLMLSLSSSVFAEQGDPSNPDSTVISVNPTVINDQESIRDNFNELGINVDTQKKLLGKMERGELLDSQNPAKINEGITTKSSNPKNNVLGKSTNSAGYTTRTVFPDGSISILSVTPGAGTVCGSGYCNYQSTKIYSSNTVVTASFLANFTIVNGGYSYISNVWEPSVRTFISTSFSNLSLNITRPSESLQFSAQASMTWIFSSIAGSQNQYLNLDVKNGVATSTPN